jgi:FkbM family methyltransferase
MPEIVQPAFFPLRFAAARFSPRNPLRKFGVEAIKYWRGDRPVLPEGLAEVRPLDMPSLSFLPNNSMVTEAIYWFGVAGYDGVAVRVWQKLCADAQSVLEIGANVGLFTVLGAKRLAPRYTAVEPRPEIAAILRENIRRNSIGSVEVLEGAAIPGPSRASVQLKIPSEGNEVPAGAHLPSDVEVAGGPSLRIVTVDGFPIQDLMRGRDLVKIDAEGVEAELLAAAVDIILENKPTLMIEVLPEAEKLGQLMGEIAKAAGYNLFILPEYGSDKAVKVSAQEFHSALPRRFNSRDVLLTKRRQIL